MQILEPNHHTRRETNFSPQVPLPQGSQPLVTKQGLDHFITYSFKNIWVIQEVPNHCRIGAQTIPWPPKQSIALMLISHGSILTSQEAPSFSYTCEEHFPCFMGFYALRLKKSWMIRGTLRLPMRYYHNRWQMPNLANRKPTPVISLKLLNARLKQDVFTACMWGITHLNAPCEQPTLGMLQDMPPAQRFTARARIIFKE